MDYTDNLPDCPVGVAIAVIGGKWKLLALKHLASGPLRFSALRDLMPGAGNKALSAALGSLVDYGIIERTVEPGKPVSVSYSLTAAGHTLKPVLASLAAWGTSYRRWSEAGRPVGLTGWARMPED